MRNGITEGFQFGVGGLQFRRAVENLLFRDLAFGDVLGNAKKHPFVFQLQFGDLKFHRERAAVTAPPLDLAPGTDDICLPRFQVPPQVGVVLSFEGFRHEDFDVLSGDFLGAVAKHFRRRSVHPLDDSGTVNRHDAFEDVFDDRGNSFLATPKVLRDSFKVLGSRSHQVLNFAQILERHDGADDGAAIEKRCDRDAGVDHRAVAPHQAAFLVVSRFAAGEAGIYGTMLVARLSGIAEHLVARFGERFLQAPAGHPLGGRVYVIPMLID